MRDLLRAVRVMVVAMLLIALLCPFGLAEEKGKMGRMGMMRDMDKMMGQCEKMRESTDMMMGKRMSKGCMGMMSMKSMGMMMHNMSQNMKGMLENMDSMMNNEELMEEAEVKKNAEQMEEHMQKMTEYMRKAMENMQNMVERMEEMQQ